MDGCEKRFVGMVDGKEVDISDAVRHSSQDQGCIEITDVDLSKLPDGVSTIRILVIE